MRTFFVCPSNNVGVYQQGGLYASTDNGVTWNKRGSIPTSSSDVEGTNGIVYLQGSDIYRSTDGGYTFKNLGGPANSNPFRFSVPPSCDGNVVVAADYVTNTVWITTDGGDGMLGRDLSPTYTPAVFPNISSCLTSRSRSTITNQHCSTLVVLSAVIENDAVGAFTLEPHTFPSSLENLHSDSFYVQFDPKTNPGTFSARLHIIGIIRKPFGDIPIDTVLPLSAVAQAEAFILSPTPASVNYDILSTCSTARDTIITLTNRGCDTLTITSMQGISAPYTIEPPLNFPITLPPDSFITVTFRFSPQATGRFVASPRFRAEQQGLSREVELFLEGFGKEEGGVFTYSPKQIDFASLSICSVDSARGFVTNTGCASLAFSDAKLTGNADYTLSSLPAMSLAPNDTVRYKVYLSPQLKGIRTGIIVFETQTQSGTRYDTVSLSVNVTDGTRNALLSSNNIDFGTTTLCTEKDTTITIRNTGCDTLTVERSDVTGTGFTDEASYPIIIPPGVTKTIQIKTQLDTAGSKSNSTGTITFTTNADNILAPVTLSRNYTYPKNYTLTLDAIPDATAGDVVRMKLKAPQGLEDVNQLDFTLDYNTDLLDYVRAEGANVTNTGTTFHISPIQIQPDGTVAELVFQVMLTKDSVTDITLHDMKLNASDPKFEECVATIQGSSSGFTYQFLCAERTLQRFLQSGSLRISSVYPNPATSSITVMSYTNAENAEVTIYDVLGKKLITEKTSLRKNSSVNIDIKHLMQGNYYLEVHTATGSVRTGFVLVK